MTNDGYKPEYAEKAFALAFAEWTNARIADYFGIDLTRFRLWERNHQAFDDALDRARSMLDDYDKEVAEGFDYRHPKRGGGGDSLNTGVVTPAGPVTNPSVASINAEAWSVAYTSPPAEFDPVGSPKYVYVSRQGYDSTASAITFTESILVTKRVRIPATLGFHATRSALSEYVYSTDIVLGGQTNNSGETVPTPIVNWAYTDRLVVGNTMPKEWLAITPFHIEAKAGKQVACVVWTITDGTNTVTIKSSTPVIMADPNDQHAVIGYMPATDPDLSSLTDVTDLTVNCKVYPRVGAAASIADSSTGTVRRLFTSRVFWKNVSAFTTPFYIYIDPVGGVDLTAVVSTTAALAKVSPALTLHGAILRLKTFAGGTTGRIDGNIVRLMSGTHTWSSGVAAGTYTDHARVWLEGDPAVAVSAVTMVFGASSYNTRCVWIGYRNMSMSRSGGTVGIPNGSALTFVQNCPIDNNSATTAFFSTGSAAICTEVMGCTFSNLSNGGVFAGSSNMGLFRGCVIASSAQMTIHQGDVIGCSFEKVGGAVPALASASVGNSGGIWAFNTVMKSSTAIAVQLSDSADMTGYALVQNVFEHITTVSSVLFRPSGDGEVDNLIHVVMHNNTFAGDDLYGRNNMFYNETSATLRTHKFCSVKGNIIVLEAIKADRFALANALPNPSLRDGTFAQIYGTAHAGNFHMYCYDFASSVPEYTGLGSVNDPIVFGNSKGTKRDPQFTNNQATTAGPVAGTGGGTYTVAHGSPVTGILPSAVLAYDLAGTARSAASDDAGAYKAA